MQREQDSTRFRCSSSRFIVPWSYRVKLVHEIPWSKFSRTLKKQRETLYPHQFGTATIFAWHSWIKNGIRDGGLAGPITISVGGRAFLCSSGWLFWPSERLLLTARTVR